MAKAAARLQIAAQAQAALTPEQRKYRQLGARIEKVRAELQAWDEQLPLFAQAYGQRVVPLLRAGALLRLQLLRKVQTLLTGAKWSQADRLTLQRALLDMAADLLDDEDIDETVRGELKALYELHAEVSLDDEHRAAMAELKQVVKAVSGVDLGDEEFDSADELMDSARQRMQQTQDPALQDGAAPPAQAAGAHGRRKTPAQRRHEKEAREAQEASKSVREVYRKLASALHPDRAEDEADRQRRTALMQRVNQAYEAQDLLALFALQLEIEQVDAEHLAQASSERMRHYNRVLAAQLEELLQEVAAREDQFGLQFGIEPWVRPNPRKLEPLLREQARKIRVFQAQLQSDLRALESPPNVKHWIKQMRQAQAMEDDGPFDFRF